MVRAGATRGSSAAWGCALCEDEMTKRPGWGGRRDNQTGRPPKADRKIRVGTIFLSPDDVARLAARTNDRETLTQAAARLLTDYLREPR